MYRHVLPFRQIPLYYCFLHWYNLPFSHLCITMLVYGFLLSFFFLSSLSCTGSWTCILQLELSSWRSSVWEVGTY